MTRALVPVPDGPVGPDGSLRIGRYTGTPDALGWGRPSPWLERQARRVEGRKRWFQAGVFFGDSIVVIRLVDHGPIGSGLVWVADLSTGRTLLEHRLPGIPIANLAVGPFAGRGTEAHATLPLARIRLARDAGSSAWELTAHLPGHAVAIGLDTQRAPIPVLFIGEPAPGSGVVLQRFVGLEARGTVRFLSEVKPLESAGRAASGFLEYGNGYFPRPIRWSSALLVGGAGTPWAHASDLGSFGEDGESTVWQGDEPDALGVATLSGSADTREPWRVRTRDGGLALHFQPRTLCNERAGLGPAMMRHALVAGRFQGSVATSEGRCAIDAPGLCEARAFG
jgi:hypothetical protein